jgi:hypothetical protein
MIKVIITHDESAQCNCSSARIRAIRNMNYHDVISAQFGSLVSCDTRLPNSESCERSFIQNSSYPFSTSNKTTPKRQLDIPEHSPRTRQFMDQVHTGCDEIE